MWSPGWHRLWSVTGLCLRILSQGSDKA
jgi:hypothetical protein